MSVKLFDCEGCEKQVNILSVHNNKLLCRECVELCSCTVCVKQFISTYKPQISEHDSDGLYNEDY